MTEVRLYLANPDIGAALREHLGPQVRQSHERESSLSLRCR